MNILLLIISMLALALFLQYRHIRYLRFKNICNLKSKYEEMEMFFVKENIKFTKDHDKLMMLLKTTAVNPGFLDVHVLLVSKVLSEKNNTLDNHVKWFEDTIKSMPEGFQQIFMEYDEFSDNIIVLSYLKPEFLWFVVKCVFRRFINDRINGLKELKEELNFVKDNEAAITYSTLKAA
ncbi:hypothetical protein [Aquimarina sp. 2201CG5-10]|uniref:hypothetical protein n=1 Tax=Aquimarina callyspongiae TaxID=3098150 RepID=UPI002AB46114|nr:hypothetical protein [Aquimarina sp. 2201CG5-10]MDY8137615.1 hypothetical protein [Aquimarina sp. 2201CG5-10]